MHPLDFPLWLRVLHFCNLLFATLLIRSGLEILSAHPKLYWSDDCVPGTAWLNFAGGIPSNRRLEPTPEFGRAAMPVGAASNRKAALGGVAAVLLSALCVFLLAFTAFIIMHVLMVVLHGFGRELAPIVLGQTSDPQINRDIGEGQGAGAKIISFIARKRASNQHRGEM